MRGLEIKSGDEIGLHKHVWEHDCDSLDPWEFGSEQDIDAAAADSHLPAGRQRSVRGGRIWGRIWGRIVTRMLLVNVRFIDDWGH